MRLEVRCATGVSFTRRGRPLKPEEQKEVLRRLRPSRRQVHTAPFPRPLYSILLSLKTHVVCDSNTKRQSPIGDHGPSPPNSPMRSRHNILLSALSSSTVLSSSIRTFFLLPDTLPWDPSRASIHSVVPGAQQSAYSPRSRLRFVRSRVHISQGAFPFAGLDSVAPQDPHPLNPRRVVPRPSHYTQCTACSRSQQWATRSAALISTVLSSTRASHPEHQPGQTRLAARSGPTVSTVPLLCTLRASNFRTSQPSALPRHAKYA